MDVVKYPRGVIQKPYIFCQPTNCAYLEKNTCTLVYHKINALSQ